MQVEVLPAAALGDAEAARWRHALADGGRPVHPLLTPDFAAAVGRIRPGAGVAVLRAGDRHGWLAFEPRGRGVGEVVGKGFTDVGGLPTEPGLPQPDYRQLLRACGLGVWRVVQADPQAGPLTGPLTAPPPGARVLGHAPNPVIDLSAGYQAHLAHLRRHAPASLRTVRKHERRLARDTAPVRYVFEERDPRLLEVMLRWKSAQYRASGWTDPLAAARGGDLARSLATLRSPGCTGAVSVLYLGDEPAAIALTLRSHNAMTCCITGYNQRHAAHSPGTVLLGRIIESAAGLGLATVDLGEGDQEYKRAQMTEQLALPHGLLWRPGVTAAACLARDTAGVAARDFITSRPRLRSGTRAVLRRYGALRGGA